MHGLGTIASINRWASDYKERKSRPQKVVPLPNSKGLFLAVKDGYSLAVVRKENWTLADPAVFEIEFIGERPVGRGAIRQFYRVFTGGPSSVESCRRSHVLQVAVRNGIRGFGKVLNEYFGQE